MIPPKYITHSVIGLFFLIAIIPVAFMFGNSFVFEGGVSLKYYFDVFGEARVWLLLLKSLVLASGTTFLALILGVPLAFLLTRTNLAGKKMWQWLYLIPLCIPPYLQAISWIYLFGGKGIVNERLMTLFTLSEPPLQCQGAWGVLIILAFSYYPFVVLLAMSGFNNMDQRVEDAARLQFPLFKVMRTITFPILKPYIVSGAIFVFIFSLFNYGVPALLGVHTYPIEIFAQFSAFYNQGGAMAQSLPMVFIGLILLIIQYRLMGSRNYVTMSTGRKSPALFDLGRYNRIAALMVGSVILVSVILPLAVLLWQAGRPESYQIALRTSYREIATSLIFSLVAASAMIALSYFLCETLENKKTIWGIVLDFSTFLPFAFPATVVGIGLIYFWNHSLTQVVYQSPLIVIIAYIARFIPFSLRTLNAGFKQISPSLREAALLAKRSWWQKILSIDLPLLSKGLGTGWMVVFFLCMGELGAILLVIPPGEGTLALKIYTLMHYGAGKLVAALALIMVAVNLFMAGLLLLVLNRQRLQWNTEDSLI
jgi:iron(III) transport system permease protein